jgi:hypothetical protein
MSPEAKRELKRVGWTKGLELAKLARAREGQAFDCAAWLHKAKVLPRGVPAGSGKGLTDKDSEPWEIIYFKLYKSQVPVVEQAIGTAALMLGRKVQRILLGDDLCRFSRRGPVWMVLAQKYA